VAANDWNRKDVGVTSKVRSDNDPFGFGHLPTVFNQTVSKKGNSDEMMQNCQSNDSAAEVPTRPYPPGDSGF
jgi:hypothetical protein